MQVLEDRLLPWNRMGVGFNERFTLVTKWEGLLEVFNDLGVNVD